MMTTDKQKKTMGLVHDSALFPTSCGFFEITLNYNILIFDYMHRSP